MKTCDRLRHCGFHSIRMMEVRQRPFDGRKHPFETVDLGLESEEESVRASVSTMKNGVIAVRTDAVSTTEIETDIKTEININSNGDINSSQGKNKRDLVGSLEREDCSKKSKVESSIDEGSSSRGKVKTEGEAEIEIEGEGMKFDAEQIEVVSEAVVEVVVETEESRIEREEKELKQAIYLTRMANKYVMPIMPVKDVLIARPLATMKGHTAFLTFAVRPPLTLNTPK